VAQQLIAAEERAAVDEPVVAHARPVFVVGSPRSGTSVFTWSLGQHPNILPLPESNWLSKLAVNLTTAYDLATVRGEHSALAAMGVQDATFAAAFGDTVDRLILAHRARYEQRREGFGLKVSRGPQEPKRRWVDGTPEYSLYIVALRRLFPNAQFIHLLRDVRLVARSLSHFDSIGGERMSRVDAYQRWLRNVRACLDAERAYGSRVVLRVRHQDLLDDPERLLRRCFAFLGEEHCAEALEPLKPRKVGWNASQVSDDAAEEQPMDPGDEDVVRAAERLADQLLSEADPYTEPDPDLAEKLERRYEASLVNQERFLANQVPAYVRGYAR
jgi:hypothetical protein